MRFGFSHFASRARCGVGFRENTARALHCGMANDALVLVLVVLVVGDRGLGGRGGVENIGVRSDLPPGDGDGAGMR